jgi:SAM-dependent methyltransferase/uncharacterized protein YbaR (Trm112 family)
MKKSDIKYFFCLTCRKSDFSVYGKEVKGLISTGKLLCNKCGHVYPISRGIVYTISKLSSEAKAEIRAWEKFADSEGWLNPPKGYLNLLPSPKALQHVPNDSINWKYHEQNFFDLIKPINFKGKLVLDLAAGRCWSTKHLSLLGADCIATDIMDHHTIGLGAGSTLMRLNDIYFERIVSDMNNLPFKKNVFDYILITGSLHHTLNLGQTISEISRVLKKGGLLLVTNEPCSKSGGDEIIQMTGIQTGINEHSFRITRLLKILSGTGFKNIIIQPGVAFYDRTKTHYYGGKLWCLFVKIFPSSYFLYLFLNGGTISLHATRN